jgi:mannose-6-phosphate isomerase-like protein (cupin superfamily)
MQVTRLENYTKGWVVGDFEPSIIRTKDFEMCVKNYKKDEVDAKHVHKIAREVTVIVSGEFIMNNQHLLAGDVADLLPGESAEFKCIKDGSIAVIKTPSIKGDKYLI